MQIHVIGENDPHLPAVHALFREYNDFLGFDLCFQNFESELHDLPGRYALPHGRLYYIEHQNTAAACAGFYRLDTAVCELKRLYVRPQFTGRGMGKALLARALEDARTAGYHSMRLDTLRRLESAGALYRQFGFREIAPYNHSPLDDVYYMEKTL